MDLTNFMSPDEFNKLSEDEKYEAIRNLIHMINEDSQAKAVLFNPVENVTYSIEELINKIGEEEVIKLLAKAIEEGNMSPKSISKEELKEIIERKENGTATPEDERTLELFNRAIEDDEAIKLNKSLTAIVIELVDFTQNERHFAPTFGDFIATFNIIAVITGVFTEDSSLSKYKQMGPSIIHHMTEEIARDILDTWINTCSEVPDDYTMLCALLEATQIYANKVKMCDAELYREVLHDILPDIEIDNDEECNCCHGDCHCESENGSNKESKQPNIATPKTYKPSDKDMRDMLKE